MARASEVQTRIARAIPSKRRNVCRWRVVTIKDKKMTVTFFFLSLFIYQLSYLNHLLSCIFYHSDDV